MNKVFVIFVFGIFFSCGSQQTNHLIISKSEMMRIVKECDNNFRIGLQNKDSALLVSIYSDSAQYVQPQRPILKGKTEIGKEWAGFIRIKEKPVDLILNIHDVRGNREIIYETGQGYTLLADSSKWNFNYVNVWRLQNDGTYKLEIDTYN
jgi:ketosteroid isomerase-like protein